MKRFIPIYLLSAVLLITVPVIAQQQHISYVDTEYILDQLPDYRSAQKQLDDAASKWKEELQRRKAELDKLTKSYNAEFILLPEETRKKREEEIAQRQKSHDDYQKEKFGAEGELFKKRQQLLKPIQDKVFKAVQEVAKENAQDFIFDKAGAVTMLFSNAKYDRSDEVIDKLKILAKTEAKEAAKKEMQGLTPTINSTTQPNNINQNINSNSNPGGNAMPPGGQQPPQPGQMPQQPPTPDQRPH